MIEIYIIDLISSINIILAIGFLIYGWQTLTNNTIGFLFFTLFVSIMFYNFCMFIEWSAITQVLEPYENFAGAIIPVLWGFIFFYYILHEKNIGLRHN
ncbi:MAG: hypothetical protein K9M80_07920 [Candidatus Marinimicrobia bacterium]|nr:hypothetical protein [Candidatus Neomarinimicrobiota bacterium]